MSLVERALKKIQESRGGLPPPVATAVNAALPAVAAPLAEAPRASLPAALPPVLAQPPVLTQPAPVRRSTRVVRVDRSQLRLDGILPPSEQEKQLADEYRHIKRPLIANALGRGVAQLLNGRVIMLASALPGDGKTFTSINLALSMALEKDLSVLLIDADVAKRHVSRIFGVEADTGLLDVLRDNRTDVESVILQTDIPGLNLLSVGKPSDTANELLGSDRMREIVAQLAARDPNRIVLFDSPPLLLTSESRVLANIAGQVVLVVRAGSTPQRAVFDALDLLGEGKSIGLVLNQSDEQRGGYYDSYGSYGEAPGETD